MSTFKYLPQYFSTTLNVGGGIDASQTTGIVLLSVSGVDITKPGQICISYSDPLDTGVAEWINYTSINGSNELVGVTRGCEGYSAHTHLPSAVIQFTLSATHLNDLTDVVNGIKAKDLVTTAGGTTTYTLTPTPAVGAYVTGQEFSIKMNATNTGASTINVSGLGAKSLTKGGATALASGDLLIDAAYKIVYDGTQFQVSGISSTVPVKASGAEVTTGTDDAKFATPKALADAGVNTRLSSKIITSSRDMTAATGSVAYTGVGFVPTSIHAIYYISGTLTVGHGFCDSARTGHSVGTDATAWNSRGGAQIINAFTGTTNSQQATVSSFDADGFTLSWTKGGTPTGTLALAFLCYK